MRRPVSLAVLLFVLVSCRPVAVVDRRVIATETPSPLRELESTFSPGLSKQWQSVPLDLAGATYYEIDLVLDSDLAEYAGRQIVHYRNNESVSLDQVAFILFPRMLGGEMTVSDTTVDGAPAQSAMDDALPVLKVHLPAPLAPQQAVDIGLRFSGRVADSTSINFGVQAFSDGVLALAHFYPTVPVYAEQGWDVEIPPPSGDVTFNDAAFYMVSVDAPADLVVVASGVEVARKSQDNRQLVTFAAGPARDFYLAASSDFQEHRLQVGDVIVTYHAGPEQASATDSVLAYAAAALELFGRRFGPYPYTELDIVGTPTQALGIEYPGVVALADRILEPHDPRLEPTVVHEIAHQWFYNLVGNDQLGEPWLDEALAQYATLLYFEAIYGKDGGTVFRHDLEARWERVDRARIPVGLPVAAYSGQEYGAIVYGRAPLFFDELRADLGDQAFGAFLREYVRRFAWGIATADGLQEEAEAAAGHDLTPLFESWVY